MKKQIFTVCKLDVSNDVTFSSLGSNSLIFIDGNTRILENDTNFIYDGTIIKYFKP